MAKRLGTKLTDKASLPYFIAAHERARRGKGMRKEIAHSRAGYGRSGAMTSTC